MINSMRFLNLKFIRHAAYARCDANTKVTIIVEADTINELSRYHDVFDINNT
jgi:hypothetical protein